jgi:hypothetical protein
MYASTYVCMFMVTTDLTMLSCVTFRTMTVTTVLYLAIVNHNSVVYYSMSMPQTIGTCSLFGVDL